MIIREYNNQDLDAIQGLDIIMWLSIQWNGALHTDDVFVAEDEAEGIIGVAGLQWDGTWYYIEKNREDIPAYFMNIYSVYDEDSIHFEEARTGLLLRLKEHFNSYKERYADKKVFLRCWFMDDERIGIESALKLGYRAEDITLLLSYDLTKPLPLKRELQDIKIGLCNCSEEEITEYLCANEKGYDNVQDSPETFRFNIQGENTRVFTATAAGKVVSSCMTWPIAEHSAVENVFTIPEYRHRGIASETIYTALRYLKESGVAQATLTVRGNNSSAYALYFKLGFSFKQNMIELRY